MTISVESVQVGTTMDKLTDPLTSDSELEEGEIASDEIEIISEIIRQPPTKHSIQSNATGHSVSSSRKSSSSSSFPKLDNSTHAVVRPSGRKPAEKSDSKRTGTSSSSSFRSGASRKSEKSPGPVRSSSSSRKRVEPYKTKSENNNSSRSRSSSRQNDRAKPTNTRQPSNRQPSGQLKRENEKLFKTSSKDSKWKQSFELVTPGSVESVAAHSSGSETDEEEEIKLRLEALYSVGVNAKPKEVSNNINSPVSPLPVPETDSNNAEEMQEEDEDEELLRAQLLIEVARKQTKELELELPPELASKTDVSVAAHPPIANVFDKRMNNNNNKHVAKPMLVIPKADRLVIDLRDDSSDSDDEEEEEEKERDRVEVSIANLLKTARQTVEEKVAVLPHALSHLPRNQQEEYQRLKQEILRREKFQSMNKQPAANPVKSNDTEAEQPAVPVQISSTAPLAKELPKKTTNRSPAKQNDGSAKMTALKQQLLHKKRDLAATKGMLKNQLELVDKNRSLWMKSSAEVGRLKEMLSAAEETEKQLRNQLTNSQLQMQRLKTKMQSVERQVTVLHNGIGAHRTRKLSARVKPKTTNGLPSAPSQGIVLPATPFRVKPRVFAKALAKTAATTVAATPRKEMLSEVLVKKRTLHDEQWLYGTLGDDCGSITDHHYPLWSPHGHASRSLTNEGTRVDSSMILCCYQLDATSCKIVPCPFQHLPDLAQQPTTSTTPQLISSSTASSNLESA